MTPAADLPAARLLPNNVGMKQSHHPPPLKFGPKSGIR
jgi:hypothetical protein